MKPLRRVVLTSAHQPSGTTLHVGMPVPSELQIATHGADDGFYLLYCDSSGHEFTDTWHMTIEDALRQAEIEFTVRPHEWTELGL